jgi:hypothetical protein
MKTYFAWIGSNATTGTPNPTTGRLSTYGHLHSFTSKALRDEFCNEYDHRFNKYPAAISRRGARSMHLGMSVAAYNEYINYMEFSA